MLSQTVLSQEGSPSASRARSAGRVYFTALFALALLLRTAIACTLLGRDPRLSFFNQASELGCLAHTIITGHGFASPFGGDTGPSAFLAPGYPFLVALAFRIFGAYSGGAAAMLVVCQMIFGALTVPVLMSLANRIFGARAANIAGVLCAASPALVFLPLIFWETSLSSLLLLSVLALALRCAETPRPTPWVVMGALCGFTLLVNPALMLVLAAALVWASWRMQPVSKPVSKFVPRLAVAACLLVFIAWPIRNFVAFHTFIPLRSNLGYELWQGNRLGSNGEFSASLHPNVNIAERTRYAQLGEIAYMHEKSNEASAAIQADPARFADLSLLRAARFWTGLMPSNSSKLIAVEISITSILAAAGLLFLWRNNSRALWLLAAPFVLYPLPYYLTHADIRFRLVLEPIALMMSVYAVQCFIAMRQQKSAPSRRKLVARSFRSLLYL